jgi:hypothetical protein
LILIFDFDSAQPNYLKIALVVWVYMSKEDEGSTNSIDGEYGEED